MSIWKSKELGKFIHPTEGTVHNLDNLILEPGSVYQIASLTCEGMVRTLLILGEPEDGLVPCRVSSPHLPGETAELKHNQWLAIGLLFAHPQVQANVKISVGNKPL